MGGGCLQASVLLMLVPDLDKLGGLHQEGHVV